MDVVEPGAAPERSGRPTDRSCVSSEFYVYDDMAYLPLCRQVTNPQRSGSISWSFNKALLLDSGFSITPEKVSHHTDTNYFLRDTAHCQAAS